MRLLVGLGNPGPRYAATRHNFGFFAVDRIASETGTRWNGWEGENIIAEGSLEGRLLLLAKPETYMNLSGRAVLALSRARGIPPGEILIFLDDMALPLGSLRIRERGGAGGHRGLASVLEAFAVDEVPRMRLGIGPGPDPGDVADFVLEPFSVEERALVSEVLDRVVAATRTILREGIAKAMSVFNAGDPSD